MNQRRELQFHPSIYPCVTNKLDMTWFGLLTLSPFRSGLQEVHPRTGHEGPEGE